MRINFESKFYFGMVWGLQRFYQHSAENPPHAYLAFPHTSRAHVHWPEPKQALVCYYQLTAGLVQSSAMCPLLSFSDPGSSPGYHTALKRVLFFKCAIGV